MHTPAPSFRDVLKAYQQQLPTLVAEKDRRLVEKVLAEWIDHADCEAIWATVRPLLKVEVARDHFIGEILVARITAKRLNTIARKAPSLERKARVRATRHLNTKEYREATATIEALGDFASRRGVLGRKGKTAARMIFMRLLSNGFVLWCGQPLDKEVAALTEICFSGEKSITTDTVRDARKKRARDDRGIQPPK
jgi:hypothetical protein